MAFVNSRQLSRHFAEHGMDFGARTQEEYEQMAEIFLTAAQRPSVVQCRRKTGDLIRFDTETEAYGVLDRNNIVRTFFKPIPCASIPPQQRALTKERGRCHHLASNLLYFQWDCLRW
jgi:hypothetical protein